MATPVSNSSSLFSKFVQHAWWIVLLVALILYGWATERRIDRVEAITDFPTWSVDNAQLDSASPTGFEKGQRSLIIPGHHNPSFGLIMEAQQAAEEGSLRLRRIDYDSAPDGREIRRTAPHRMWLISVGWLRGVFTGESLGFAIERGTLYADPLLFALMLGLGAFYCVRYIGMFASIGFMLAGICIFPLAGNFQPGAPDAHSLAWVLALGSVLPLFASLGKVGKSRRGHFVLAGVLGGLGFWNDAESQAPVLLVIALGALGYEFIRVKSAGSDDSLDASPWRAWALAGGLTALAASVFELAPDSFVWSLDSVNPIQAVIWWGFGDALHSVSLFRRYGFSGIGRARIVLFVLALLAIAAWPTVGLWSESGGLFASDFYARELANHASGGFASNLGVWLNRSSGGEKLAVLLPIVFLVVLLIRLFTSKCDREERGRMIFLMISGLVVLALAFYQVRWWNLFDVFALVVVALLFAQAEKESIQSRLKSLGLVLLLVPGFFVGFPSALKSDVMSELSPSDIQSLVERDFSYWLTKRSGSTEQVLFSTPMFSGAATYYGGFDVVVSSDGGNKEGMEAAVRIASASTDQEASLLTNSRGITHVAFPSWDPMLDQLVRIGSKLPAGQALPHNAFAVALQAWEVPMWMRALNYGMSSEAEFKSYAVQAFELQAEQEPDLALSRLADLFVERRQLYEAGSIREALKAYPRSLHAMVAIANINLAVRETAKLEESIEAFIPLLSRRAARNLPVDRRISLAVLLFQTKRTELAREQIEACMPDLDLDTLRGLSPNSVAALVALSRSFGIGFPEKAMEAEAIQLVPVSFRSHLSKE